MSELESREEWLEFVEWVGTQYVRLHGCWCAMYSDKRAKENWKSTEELYRIYSKL